MSNKIIFAVPRFSNTGGNSVTLELAKHLEKTTSANILCFSGFSFKKPDEVWLKNKSKGGVNTALNLVSFLFCSIVAVFSSNYVATHHLTCLLNFVKRADFGLVQDKEINFYPKFARPIMAFLWRNFLNCNNLIFTSDYLKKEIFPDDCRTLKAFPFISVADEYKEYNKDIDVVMCLRDGEYKDPYTTLEVCRKLDAYGFKVVLVNTSGIRVNQQFVIGGVSRTEFYRLLSRARVFCCLSEWEGLGLPNLEAYSLGCKIISTEIPSAKIISDIDNNAIKLITKQTDRREGIVEEIMEFLKSNEKMNTDERAMALEAMNNQWMLYASNIFLEAEWK